MTVSEFRCLLNEIPDNAELLVEGSETGEWTVSALEYNRTTTADLNWKNDGTVILRLGGREN